MIPRKTMYIVTGTRDEIGEIPERSFRTKAIAMQYMAPLLDRGYKLIIWKMII